MLLRSRNSPFDKGVEWSRSAVEQESGAVESSSEVAGNQASALLEAFERYETVLHEAILRVLQPDEVEDVMKETYGRVSKVSLKRSMRNPRVFMLRTVRDILLEKLAARHARAGMIEVEVQHLGQRHCSDQIVELPESVDRL